MNAGFKGVRPFAAGWALLAAFAGQLHSAATMGGPVAGYVTGVDGQTLRAILGAPGSFRFSDPLALPEGVSRLHIAPGQDFALAEQDGNVAVLALGGNTPGRLIAVNGASSPPDWVVFSPQSLSAVLFSAVSGHLQVIGGLPDTPRVSLDWDSAALGDVPRTAAISDDGKILLVASHRAVYLVPTGGPPRQLLSAAEITSLTLFRNGRDAAVWDGYAGSVHLLQDVASAAADRLLTSGLKGFGKLSPSWDGNTLFLVKSGVKSVFSIDLSSGEIQFSDSLAAPNNLEPLRNRDTFLISAGRRQPAWIFYFDGSTGRVVFVPAPPPTTEAQQ